MPAENRGDRNGPPELERAAQDVLSGYRSRPNAGLDGLLRHLSTQDPEKLNDLLHAIQVVDNSAPDPSTFDFSRVPVRRSETWIFQMIPMGYETGQGTLVDDYVDGSRPVFQLIMYNDKGQYRFTGSPPEAGLPTSEFLIDSIKRAISSPLPPMKASLPGLLIIALKIAPHVTSLRTFLDSLPAPFTWRLETREEAEGVADGVDELNRGGIERALDEAETEKRLGNEAIGRKNRDVAIQHYSEAIGCLEDGRAQKPTKEQEKIFKEKICICLANRAAAWLLEGNGQNASEALKDSKEAAKFNVNYAKAYYRQASAHQLLSKKENAVAILITALRKPPLAADKGLNDALVELYGGIPCEEQELRAFCRKINGAPQPSNPSGLKEFERRVNAQLGATIGPNVSLSSLS